MPRQFFTASDIVQLAHLRKTDVLVLGPEDIVTAEAEDMAASLGLKLLREKPAVSAEQQPVSLAGENSLPALKKVSGFGLQLDPFGSGGAGQAANVCLKDVITSGDRSPMTAGYMSLESGEFPWTLSYDEIDIVLEGELVITRGQESVRGQAGDVIFIPKGSGITFGTPNRVRFVYVTYPADWNEKAAP